MVAEVDDHGKTCLSTLRSAGPLQLRPTPGGLYLVGGAAGPIGGDDLSLVIEVGPGAALTIHSAAASVALPGPGGAGQSRMAIEALVDEGGTLEWLPEPAVAAGGCWHQVECTISMARHARLVWRDEVVLGRHHEAPGAWASRLSIDVDGRPLLRQELAVGAPRHSRNDPLCGVMARVEGESAGWAGPAVSGGSRALGSVVMVDPRWEATGPPSAVLSDRGAVLALVGPGAQVVALADGAVTLRRLLDQGLRLLAPSRQLFGPPDGRGVDVVTQALH